MKSFLLACSLFAASTVGFTQDVDFTITINWDANHYSGHNYACNRRGQKASSVNGSSFQDLTRKLEFQTNILRKSIAREAYIYTPGGSLVIAERENRACRDVRFPVACKRAVNFEERADTIKHKYNKYKSELTTYRAAMGGFDSSQDARLEAKADQARAKAHLLKGRIDEKLADLLELKMGLQSALAMNDPETQVFKGELIAQIKARKHRELEQVAEAITKAKRLEIETRNYAPISNRQVALAKRELAVQVQSTIDEYLLLKKSVKKNSSLAQRRISSPGNFPNNSYENEMRCASNVFNEIVEDVNRLPIQ
mgnify:FL=1